MENRLAAFFMQKKEVPCMGCARKDVEKTKKIAKKFCLLRLYSLSKKFHCVFMDNALIMNV